MLKISARNQLAGTVSEVKKGAVNGVVTIDLGCTKIKADITCEAIDELGLAEGVKATAVIKASNVLFAIGADKLAISARNQFRGTVSKVAKGAVNGHVALTTPCGQVISGSITNEAIDELGLAEGVEAIALVKSTDVLVAVEA